MEGRALFWGFNREGGKYTGEVEVMRVCFSQWSNLREVILFPQHASWCSAYCGCSVNTRWVNYIILSRLRNPQRGTPGKQDGLPVWLAHTDSLQFTEVLAAYLCLPFLVSINAIHVLGCISEHKRQKLLLVCSLYSSRGGENNKEIK